MFVSYDNWCALSYAFQHAISKTNQKNMSIMCAILPFSAQRNDHRWNEFLLEFLGLKCLIFYIFLTIHLCVLLFFLVAVITLSSTWSRLLLWTNLFDPWLWFYCISHCRVDYWLSWVSFLVRMCLINFFLASFFFLSTLIMINYWTLVIELVTLFENGFCIFVKWLVLNIFMRRRWLCVCRVFFYH